MILFAMLMIQAAAPAPSAEAVELSRRVAGSAALVRLLPLIATKEGKEMVKDLPELSPAEQAELRATAKTVADATRVRLVTAMAPAFASALTVPQMRAIVAFDASDAAKARQAAELPAIVAATTLLDGFDFKGEVRKAFCEKTGKGCPAAKNNP